MNFIQASQFEQNKDNREEINQEQLVASCVNFGALRSLECLSWFYLIWHFDAAYRPCSVYAFSRIIIMKGIP